MIQFLHNPGKSDWKYVSAKRFNAKPYKMTHIIQHFLLKIDDRFTHNNHGAYKMDNNIT